MADPEAGGAAHAIKGEVADLKAALVLAYVRPKLCTSARPGGVPKPRRGQRGARPPRPRRRREGTRI